MQPVSTLCTWRRGATSRFAPETIVIRDGRTVLFRPIRPEDAALLLDFDRRLSERSRYFRMHGSPGPLTPSMALYLASVDFVGRHAIVGVVDEMEGPAVVVVGRVEFGEPGTAELALVARDDYQALGLGTAMLARLVETARWRGASVIVAPVLGENAAMLKLLAASGFVGGEARMGVIELTLDAENPPPGQSVVPVLTGRRRRRVRFIDEGHGLGGLVPGPL